MEKLSAILEISILLIVAFFIGFFTAWLYWRNKYREKVKEYDESLKNKDNIIAGKDTEITQLNRIIEEHERQDKEVSETNVPEELYVRIVKEMGEGVTVSNETGNFVVYNPKMEEMTGYSKEEANNNEEKIFLDTLYPDAHLREKVAKHISEIPADGESNNIKTLITTKDRKKVHALVTSTSVRYNDKSYYLSVYRDISERPKVEA